MWLDILVMMFLFSKYTKLNIILICVYKAKRKLREYLITNTNLFFFW